MGLNAGRFMSFADAAEQLFGTDADKAFVSLREQQIGRLRACGFTQSVGLDEKAFTAQVPSLAPAVLRSLKKEENLLLVVPENLIDAKQQMELASLRIWIDPSRKKEDYSAPDSPYWIAWRLAGGDAPSEAACLYDPQPPERPPSMVEGVHLAVQYPQLLDNLAIALTGSSMPNGHVGILCHWRGKPQISVICRAAANRYAVVGGRVMIVRELPQEAAI